jgi:hypothetical protein
MLKSREDGTQCRHAAYLLDTALQTEYYSSVGAAVINNIREVNFKLTWN